MKDTFRILKRIVRYVVVGVIGFVVGVAGLVVYIVRSGPELDVWHTAELTKEFTADRTDVKTFDDYLALEDELFAQLDELVYARTPTGSLHTLARYSAGSVADPRELEPNWNRSFELPADDPAGGVLLLHGMSDSPYSFRTIGQSLNDRGYWVIGLRLPGHGTAPSGLVSAETEDAAAAVRLAVMHLAAKVGPDDIHLMGYSNGAPLALDYTLEAMDDAAAPDPRSLVLISPSVGVTRLAVLAKWKRRLAYVPGMEKAAWTSVLPEFDPYKYNSFTTNAGAQVHRLTVSVQQRIAARAAGGPIADFPPTLVLLSTVDATVSVDAVIDGLLTHLGPDDHELVLFDLDRTDLNTTILVSDPGPLTFRLMGDDTLPFHLTLVANERVDSRKIVSHQKPPFSKQATVVPLDTKWPEAVISLSHVALPFPPDDPIYGRRPEKETGIVHLGEIEIRGERGLLVFPADWLLRLRHNPFYDFFEDRLLDWVDAAAEPDDS